MSTEPELIEAPDRRVSPYLIILLIVVVLAALYWFVVQPLFLTSEDPLVAPPATTSDPVGDPAADDPAPEAEAPPEETFEVFESKDPFRPLVSTAESSGTTTNGDTSGDTSGASGAPAPTGGQVVALLDVFTDDGVDKAQVKVGSTVYTVSVGEVFADNYKLVSTSGDCATLLHGDDKFTLCEGEEVVK